MKEQKTTSKTNGLKPNSKELHGSPFFQPKLTINQPNDAFEKEADAVAEHVMRKESSSFFGENQMSFFKPVPVTTIQRKCDACEKEEEKIQRQEMGLGEEVSGVNSSPDFESYVEGLNSGGSPLPNESKSFFEGAMGYDFSNVRIHNDAKASESADSINALAYTTGKNIVFNQNQFQPSTKEGQKLLAHELTHVVQQGNGIQPKKIQRVSFEKDSSNCTITANHEVGTFFVYSDRTGEGWTVERQTRFKDALKRQIEATFNANTYRIAPRASNQTMNWFEENILSNIMDYSCHCTAGFHPLLNVNVTNRGVTSSYEGWHTTVIANQSGTFHRSSAAAGEDREESFGNLDEADINATPLTGQVPVVHEFGHYLGLMHPGYLKSGVTQSQEYTYSGNDRNRRPVDGRVDLMGESMGLRPFYFNGWKDNLNSSYPGCDYNITQPTVQRKELSKINNLAPQMNRQNANSILRLKRVSEGEVTSKTIQRVPRAAAPAPLPNSLAAYPASDKQRIQIGTTAVEASAIPGLLAIFATNPTTAGGATESFGANGTVVFSLNIPDAIPNATFDLKRGLTSVAGNLENSTNLLPLNHTITIILDLTPFGGVNSNYRFSYFQHGTGAAIANVTLIELLGTTTAIPTTANPTNAAPAGAFTVGGQSFTLASGWTEIQNATLLQALNLLPAAALTQLSGVTFARGAAAGTEAGSYTDTTHTIKILDNAFTSRLNRYSSGTESTRIILHEIGHALDYLPMRNAWTAYSGSGNARALTRVRSASGLSYGANSSGDFSITEGAATTAFRTSVTQDRTIRGVTLPDSITTYGATSWEENYAEAFAFFMADRALFLTLRPHTHAYFLRQYP